MMVEIVIPVYNAEDYLRETLESVFAQTYEAFHVIAVDDGSEDASPEILEEFASRYPGKIDVVTQNNQGGSAARNQGLSRVRADYVTFFDADDVMEPDMLEVLVSAMQETGADLTAGGLCDRG